MLNRRNFLVGCAASALFITDADAWTHGVSPIVPGKTQIGGFDTNGNSFAFINFMKMANGQLPVSAFAFPAVLDANGYPNNSGASLATAINSIVTLPAVYGTSDWVLKWTGDGAFKLSSASLMTVTANTGCSVSGSGSGVIAVTSSGSGSSPRVVFHFAAGTPSAGFAAIFSSGATYTNMANLVLCRADQESLLTAGQIFNPNFLALMRALNPKTLRLMNWCSVDGLMSQFAYRAPTSAMSYRISRWQPGAWAGVVGNTGDAYSCSAPSGWGGLVEGAIIQGQFTNSNSANLLTVTSTANNGSGAIRCTVASTASLSNGQQVGFSSNGGATNNAGVQFGGGVYTVSIFNGTQVDLVGSTFNVNHSGTISATTLNVGGTGAKLLSGVNGATANVSAMTANTCSTCIYDSVRDAWVYWPHGMSDASENGQIPIEMQVALCNALGFNLWTNMPFEYTDASVTALATYVRDNLSASLNCYYEYSNEVWNFVDTGSPKAWIRGQQFGFASDRLIEGYYGLRVRQIMGNITTVYGVKTNYRRVMAFQAFSSPSFNQTNKFNGGPLVAGNAKYNAFTGSTAYNTFPNRPIDFCDTMAYATYFSGAVLNNGDYEATGTYTGMTGAADDYASLDPTRQAAALSWVDTDLRSGTSTIPGFTKQTIAALNSTANIGSGAIGVYPSWEASAALYDGARPSGMANLTIENYEGGNESTAPTTAQCTTIGISPATYGGTTGTVNVLLTAYKNSSLFQQLVIDQYTQMQAASPAPRVTTPSWFALQGASKWSMLTGDTYTGPVSLGSPPFTGTPFKSWDGTVAYNH